MRSGTVTFETYVIDALGIDCAAIESTERLPEPIAGGSEGEDLNVLRRRVAVPLGVHIETRDVSVRWE